MFSGAQDRVHFIEIDHTRRQSSSQGENCSSVLLALSEPFVLNGRGINGKKSSSTLHKVKLYN